MRFVLGAGLTLVALTGCGGAEDETQRYARETTESHVRGNPAYDTDEVRCTANPRPWFVEEQARVVICAVRLVDGGCDWYRVELVPTQVGARTTIRLEQKDAGCVLPP